MSTTLGVVSVLNDKATCTIHGSIGEVDEFTDAESYADEHVDQHPDCWADHCGGKGCTNVECICQHQAVRS